MELEDVNSLAATAEYLGISETVLRRLARDRKIGFLRIGRSYMFPREVVKTYVEGNTITQMPPNPLGLTDGALRNVRRGKRY
jgi:excisionase family DNA binding protein